MQSRKRGENSAIKYLRLTNNGPRKWPSAKSKEPFSSATNVKLRSNCEHAACLGCRQNYENTFSDPSLHFITSRWFSVLCYNLPRLCQTDISALCARKYIAVCRPTAFNYIFAIHRARSNYVSKISKLWRNCTRGWVVREFSRVYTFFLLRHFSRWRLEYTQKRNIHNSPHFHYTFNVKCNCPNVNSC